MTDDVYNIMLNLSGGLMPKDLSKEEVDTLKTELGDDWFWQLGYSAQEIPLTIHYIRQQKHLYNSL